MNTSLMGSLTGAPAGVPWPGTSYAAGSATDSGKSSMPRRRPRSRFHTAHSCAAPNCPYKGKLWPSWLRIVSPVEFGGRAYCDVQCLQPALEEKVRRLQTGFVNATRKQNRMPVGLLLLQRGLISQNQLREALQRQREAGRGKIGYWLRELGLVDEQNLTCALAQQYGCPTFPLERLASPLELDRLVPLTLLESACAVPAHAGPDEGALYLAFGDRVDRSTLFAIEQMLGRQTIGCVAKESVVHELLEQYRRTTTRTEIHFESMREAVEVTRTVFNYSRELKAQRIALISTRNYIWARLERQSSSRDLLFRMIR
jgi:hypothetical protein